eukprot:jgi/Undpi1/10340/HiC_scaffold_29.g12790.m1
MLLPALQTGEKVYVVKEAEALEDAVATKTGEKASVLKEAEAPDNVVAANAKASKSFMTGLLVGRAGGVRIYKALQTAAKHESEYVDYEPPSNEEMPTLPEDVSAAEAATTTPAPADPTFGAATPTAPLTREDIYHQVEDGNLVLQRLHDQLACLERAEATNKLDAKISQAEKDLALLVAQRADLPNASGIHLPTTTPARRAAQTAPACAPPSTAATPSPPSPPFTLGFENLDFVHTPIRQLVSAMGIKDDEERIIVSRVAYATKKYFPDHILREALEELGGVTDLAAREVVLHLVDTMRSFTVRNSDHVCTHRKEKDQAGPSAFSLLLRLLSTYFDNGDQGRAFEKLQAFGVPTGTVY